MNDMIELVLLPSWFVIPVRVFFFLTLLSGFFGAALGAWKLAILRRTGVFVKLASILMACLAFQMAMALIASAGDTPRPHHTNWYIACSLIGWSVEVGGIWTFNVWLFRLGNVQ